MVVFRAWDGDEAVVVDVMEAEVSSSPFPSASSPPSSRLEALLFDGAFGVFKKSKAYGGKNLFVKPKVKPSLLKMNFGCEVVVDSLVVQPVLKKQVAKRPWFDDSPLPPLKRCKVDGVLNVVDGLKQGVAVLDFSPPFSVFWSRGSVGWCWSLDGGCCGVGFISFGALVCRVLRFWCLGGFAVARPPEPPPAGGLVVSERWKGGAQFLIGPVGFPMTVGRLIAERLGALIAFNAPTPKAGELEESAWGAATGLLVPWDPGPGLLLSVPFRPWVPVLVPVWPWRPVLVSVWLWGPVLILIRPFDPGLIFVDFG